jgi:hypothetical protein
MIDTNYNVAFSSRKKLILNDIHFGYKWKTSNFKNPSNGHFLQAEKLA